MSAASGGAAAGMPGLPEVWQWQEQLVGFGTRYTGSSGHAAYVDWLAGQLPGGARLQDADGPADFHVTPAAGRARSRDLCYPYSGQTPPAACPAAWSISALPARQRLHRGVLGARPGAGSPWSGPRLRCSRWIWPTATGGYVRPDLRPGGHRVRGVRCRADQSCLAGRIRAGSAARREERRGARRGGRLDSCLTWTSSTSA